MTSCPWMMRMPVRGLCRGPFVGWASGRSEKSEEGTLLVAETMAAGMPVAELGTIDVPDGGATVS